MLATWGGSPAQSHNDSPRTSSTYGAVYKRRHVSKMQFNKQLNEIKLPERIIPTSKRNEIALFRTLLRTWLLCSSADWFGIPIRNILLALIAAWFERKFQKIRILLSNVVKIERLLELWTNGRIVFYTWLDFACESSLIFK